MEAETTSETLEVNSTLTYLIACSVTMELQILLKKLGFVVPKQSIFLGDVTKRPYS
jgi:hypothetical protein